MLEVDVLVVVVVVVAVDPVVDVRHSVKDSESHSGKHQGNKLKLLLSICHKSLFCRHSLLVPFYKLFQNFCTPMLLLEEEKSITKCVQA